MANEWYRRLENQIIGTIDSKKKKADEKQKKKARWVICDETDGETKAICR